MISMLRAYQGYSEGNGRFTFVESPQPQIPKGLKVYIVVTDDEADDMSPTPVEKGTLTPEQHAGVINFLSALEKINKEEFTEEDKEAFTRWDSGEYRLKLEERLP